jgi:hypothetical protein
MKMKLKLLPFSIYFCSSMGIARGINIVSVGMSIGGTAKLKHQNC